MPKKGNNQMSEDIKTADSAAGADSLDRIVGLSDPLPNIPEDDYDPVYRYWPERQSAPDSIAGGLWVWRKSLFGFAGRNTGVMLSPEWVEVLER
jgi:hypothetical protein